MDTARVIEAEAPTARDRAVLEADPSTRPSVLMVDDDERNLLALQAVLADLDVDVVIAHSGEDALRALLDRTFAVMLLDVKMPGIDGYETAAIVRRRSKTRVMPIIFLTAFNKDDADIFQGYSAGAVDYVIKPINPVVLRSKVAVFVELYRTAEELRRQVELERRLRLENQEVRAQKQEAEEALRRVEEQRSQIIRALPIAVYSAEIGGDFAGPRYLSDSMARVSGFAPVDFLHDRGLWPARIHPEDAPRVRQEIAQAAGAGCLATEYRWRCADGAERWFLDQGVVLHDGRGEPREIVGTCLDVTERRQMEQDLAHSQKMDAIGKLTGGIAHDFNNMLTIVIGNLDMLCRTLPDRGDHDRAQMALTGAINCAELTRRLLAVARRQPLQPRVLDFATVLPDIAKLLSRALGEKIEVHLAMAGGLWRVEADPVQVETALLNLAINARDAMPSGGTLEIATGNATLDRAAAHKADASPGDYVVLTVRDSGAGMPPEVMARAFEPFFTTKGPGHGTGLGLSMIYGFVKQSGGFVELDSHLGVGTEIRLGLPRTDQAPAEAPAAPAIKPTNGAGRTILLVEDDEDVRQITGTLLGGLGYRVLQAARASEALAVLDDERDVALLLTDVVMPGGMGGIELAREATQRRPRLRVLLTSGYSDAFAGSSSGLAAELLQKPYRFDDLVAKLDTLFAA
jgi:PAS domain S-box-containing protein